MFKTTRFLIPCLITVLPLLSSCAGTGSTGLNHSVHGLQGENADLDELHDAYLKGDTSNFTHVHYKALFYRALLFANTEDVEKLISNVDESAISSPINTGLNSIPNFTGDTPLTYSLINGLTDIATVLLDAGADVKVANEVGYTPLHSLVASPVIVEKNKKILLETRKRKQFLKESGLLQEAKKIVDPPLPQYQSIADLAAMAEKLIRAGAEIDAKTDAIADSATPLRLLLLRENNDELMEVLVENGADLSVKYMGHAGLHIFAATNSVRRTRMFLASGADMEIKTDAGMTPLYIAAIAGNIEVARELIGMGADVNAVENHGIPMLHEATIRNRRNMVELLLKSGADVNLKDVYKRTPIFYIVNEFYDKDIFEILLKAGADTELKDYLGLSPLNYAEKYGKTHAIDKLKAKGI